ncbi:MAG: hypothetical protein PHE47_07050 [Oscillospiraceae bacterium]|nr:hypothetical protein [Oscillospiraceae bacterium]
MFARCPQLPLPSQDTSVGGPHSFSADSTAQPVTDKGYATPIDDDLKQKLTDSEKDAIAVKNAYFETEEDRSNGIIKTDIAMLGDLSANGVDVMFISDVSGSMSLFVKEMFNEEPGKRSRVAHTCACCNEKHYYKIPALLKRNNGTDEYINPNDYDIFFSLEDFANAPDINASLGGVGWNYMPWEEMFEYLEENLPDGMPLEWPADISRCPAQMSSPA